MTRLDQEAALAEPRGPTGRSRAPAGWTAAGFVALGLWSSTIAVARDLAQALGPLRAAAAIYCLAGLVGLGWLLARGGLRPALALPRRYLLGCGGLFAGYTLALYLALGLAVDHAQAVTVGVINYLWPGLTMALTVLLSGSPGLAPAAHCGHASAPPAAAGPLAGGRALPGPAGWPLFAGVGLAMAGAVCAAWPAEQGLSGSGRALPVYGLAFGAAAAWALYSSLGRRWAQAAPGNAVPLFVLATGLLLLPLALAVGGAAGAGGWDSPAGVAGSTWLGRGPRVAAQLAYMALGPTLLAYTLWDLGLRRGRHRTVVLASYFTPLVATGLACLWLGVPFTWRHGLGAGLVVAGAWLGGRAAPRAQ